MNRNFAKIAVLVLLGTFLSNGSVFSYSGDRPADPTQDAKAFLENFLKTGPLDEQTASGQTAGGSEKRERIETGDIIVMEVYPQRELSYEASVDEEGYASFPYLGKIRAAGLTVGAFEETLQKILEEKHVRGPRVIVSRRAVQTFQTVDVFGEVQHPGPVPIKASAKRPMTLIKAISVAGGFTKIAAANKVRIIRMVKDEQVTIQVKAGNILKGKEKDVILQEGDIVVVPEGFW